MEFLTQQLGQLGMVILIMALAVAGTVGILKLIKRSSGGKFPESKIAKKLNEKSKK